MNAPMQGVLVALVWVVAKGLHPDDLRFSSLDIALATHAPRNAALREPIRELQQHGRFANEQFQMPDVPIRARHGLRKRCALTIQHIIDLRDQPRAMPNLAAVELGNPRQNELPHLVAHQRHEPLRGDICVDFGGINDHRCQESGESNRAHLPMASERTAVVVVGWVNGPPFTHRTPNVCERAPMGSARPGSSYHSLSYRPSPTVQ
jgi:hypothetical protein